MKKDFFDLVPWPSRVKGWPFPLVVLLYPEYPKDLDLNNFHVETIKLLWYKCFPETCSRLAIDKDIFYIPNNFSFQEIPKYWLWAFPSNNLISLLFRCRHSIQCKFIRIFFKHWNCCDKKLTPRSYVLNNKYVMDVFWNVLIICKKRNVYCH